MASKGQEVIHPLAQHQLLADHLPSADTGDMDGRRQSQRLLSEFTARDHQPRCHGKARVAGA